MNKSYESLMLSESLFRYFIRKQYDSVEVSNEECDELNIEFAKYLFGLNLNDEQLSNTMPKSDIDVIFNSGNPFRMHGFEPSYVYHFAEFIEKMQEESE